MESKINNAIAGRSQSTKIIIKRIRAKEQRPVMSGGGTNCKVRGMMEGARDISDIPYIKIILYVELVIILKTIAEGIKIDNYRNGQYYKKCPFIFYMEGSHIFYQG